MEENLLRAALDPESAQETTRHRHTTTVRVLSRLGLWGQEHLGSDRHDPRETRDPYDTRKSGYICYTQEEGDT